MTSIGLRELRQDASEFVRRAEAGEEIVVTVSGRPAARLTALESRRWRRGRELIAVFSTPNDPTWAGERAAHAAVFDDDVIDPWAPRTTTPA